MRQKIEEWQQLRRRQKGNSDCNRKKPARCNPSASGAGENVIKGATEQTDDGVELLIIDCHVAGKIAFDEQQRLVITLPQSAAEGNISPNRRRRQGL